ncbi:MAG: c-type cytochrome [Verrucomicrobiota bacterium]
MQPPPAEWKIPPAPVIPPEQALETFQLEPGFTLQTVAAEPLLNDPVAIAFDGNGRIWVVEMQGYMPDVDGKGEDTPNGRITILEDSDGDGQMDRVKVFLDKLVLPRALALVEGGILYADQNQLYFVENKNDQAGKIEIIDDKWSGSGNVEHKPNGLMPALDNWIYNAKSNYRYRKIKGQWVKEKTEFRGQWGITQDDYGRLYTNTNSNLISAESLAPGTRDRNPHHSFRTRTNFSMDNAVWPARITCGINRGYQQDMLTKQGFLTKVTATCGPVVYRGDAYPEAYRGNLFIPEPSGLLVKRAIITEKNGDFSIKAAYQGREFLTSTDERSRIVNAYTAPDGTLYFVDFYRGILQHKDYVTSYLRAQILDRELDKHLGRGRIYRAVHQSAKPGPQPSMLGKTANQLIPYLSHPNGWWRDTAQRLIVQSGDTSVADNLREIINKSKNPLTRIHALWTLEGLQILTPADIANALESDHPKVVANAARVAGLLATGSQANETLAALKKIQFNSSPDADRQLAATLGRFRGESQKNAFILLAKLVELNKKSPLYLDLAMSGVAGQELALLKTDKNNNRLGELLIAAVVKSKNKEQISALVQFIKNSDQTELHQTLATATISSRQPQLSADLLTYLDNSDTSQKIRIAIIKGMLHGKSRTKNYKSIALKNKPSFLNDDTQTEGITSKQKNELARLFDFSGKAPVNYLKTKKHKKLYAEGAKVYATICIACHQPNGQGMKMIAPPLVDSEWVQGSEQRLIALVLDGMTGPITVNGKTYTVPEVQPVMPGLRINPEMDDNKIAAILTYVRNTWGNGAKPVSQKAVADYRKQHQARLPFTEAELKKVK